MGLVYGRDAEEPCRAAFAEWLMKIDCDQAIDWEDVAEDPPDYFLVIGCERFAVEVTSLIDAFGKSDPSRTHPAIFRELERFRSFMKSGLRQLGPLDRYWDVRVYEIPERKDWPEAKNLIFETIRAQRGGHADSLPVRFRGVVLDTLASLRPGLDVVPFFSTWPVSEAYEILKRTFEKKVCSMAKSEVPKPWILLCWCSGILVGKDSYRSVFEPANSQFAGIREEMIASYREFDAVFVVDTEGTILLRGKERFWE